MMQELLERLGFDETTADGGYLRVRCSSCEALVIQGVPCHERGCPREMHECKGCWALIPARQRYCEDCS
jgi:hypothetical protein